VRYYESIKMIILIFILIVLFIIAARVDDQKDYQRKTMVSVKKMADAAEAYQEWVLNATNPAIGVR